jgi:hypothetical protein
VNPNILIVSENILGGALNFEGGHIGDHGYRQEEIAKKMGSPVLAAMRVTAGEVARRRIFPLAMPHAYDPQEYEVAVAEHAEVLQAEIDEIKKERPEIDTVWLWGASMAGGHEADMIATEKITADRVTIYDATSMSDKGAGIPVADQVAGFAGWVHHQGDSRLLHKDEVKNHNPQQIPKGVDTTPPVGPITDLWLHRRIVATNRTMHALRGMADRQLLPDASVRVFVPENTFTMSPREASRAQQELNSRADRSGADFIMRIREGAYHAATDDPLVCVEYLREHQLDITLATKFPPDPEA